METWERGFSKYTRRDLYDPRQHKRYHDQEPVLINFRTVPFTYARADAGGGRRLYDCHCATEYNVGTVGN